MRPTLAFLLIAAALPTYGWAAEGYTDPAEFYTKVAEYNVRVVEAFDSQAGGSSAADYPMLQISAQGLDSDGATPISLPAIATDEQATTSLPNALGASGDDHQFLSGNGDAISFRLSCPVRAFGVRLIGNPSPTGDPAIPFWKMTANTASGFEAYSGTEPDSTLDPGNDVYFIGVISSDQPFDRVDLYSDNDPAAAFSFNVDDVVVATSAQKVSLDEAKTLESGDIVVPDVIVTRVHSDRFNVETERRTAGMAILGEGATRGKAVTVFGTLTATSDDERAIQLLSLVSEEDSVAPAPFGMGTLALCGSAESGKQTGCEGSVGPNNIGLDVTIWGRVTWREWNSNWLTVDDGFGRSSGTGYLGVKVVGDFGGLNVVPGTFVRVSGSCSLYKVGSTHYPLIRVASPSDILMLY